MASASPFSGDMFRHHQPFTGDVMASRVLPGLDGAFVERIRLEGYNVTEPLVGTAVQFSMEGDIEGVRLLKCGTIKPKEMNTKDIWPEAEEARLVFPEFDLSVFGAFNGSLTTPYQDLTFKVMERNGENWKVVRKGQYTARGYSPLAFRVNFLPLSASKMKFLLSAVLGEADSLQATYGEDVNSRGFPGIRIHEGRATIVTPEEPEHRFGLGIQPFFLVRGAPLVEDGEVDTTEVQFPSSMGAKVAVVRLLQSAVFPNWNWKRAPWEEAVRARKFTKRQPSELWPSPVEEDENETENSESEDEGQCPELIRSM